MVSRTGSFPTISPGAAHRRLHRLATREGIAGAAGLRGDGRAVPADFRALSAGHPVKMPIFITVDSAWHTYHVLLEEGVQQVELGQAGSCSVFRSDYARSRRPARSSTTVYRDLAAFAAVGWAVQDSTCLQRLPADERATVAQALKAMKSGGPALSSNCRCSRRTFVPPDSIPRPRNWHAISWHGAGMPPRPFG